MIIFVTKGAVFFKLGLDLLLGSTTCICNVSEKLSVKNIFWFGVSERVFISRESSCFYYFFERTIPGLKHIDMRVKRIGKFDRT